MTGQEKNTLIDMRQRGLKLHEMAKITGMKEGTIRSFFSRFGIQNMELNRAALCKQCHSPLLAKKYKRVRLFCSDACRIKWWNQHRGEGTHRNQHVYRCRYCQTEFRSYAEAKYCSRACYFASKRIGGQ